MIVQKPDLRPAGKKGKQLHQLFSEVLPAPAHSQSVPPSADRFNGIRGAVRTSRPRPPGTELHWSGASQFLATVLGVSPRPRPGGAAQVSNPTHRPSANGALHPSGRVCPIPRRMREGMERAFSPWAVGGPPWGVAPGWYEIAPLALPLIGGPVEGRAKEPATFQRATSLRDCKKRRGALIGLTLLKFLDLERHSGV